MKVNRAAADLILRHDHIEAVFLEHACRRPIRLAKEHVAHAAGEQSDAAAAFKLLGNLLLMAFTAGFTDMLALGKAMGVAPTQIASLFEYFNPGAALPGRFQRMIEAAYDQPSWELAISCAMARPRPVP